LVLSGRAVLRKSANELASSDGWKEQAC